MHSLRSPLPLVAALSFSAAHAPAQEDQIGGWHRPLWEGELGHSEVRTMLEVADMTGDGIADVVVLGNNILHVIDGASGATWYAYDEPQFTFEYMSVAASDLDGDGLTDLLIGDRDYVDPNQGLPHMGHVLAIGGGHGQVLWEVMGAADLAHFGEKMILADFDADGIEDVLTYVDSGSTNHRTCISGATGQLLWQVKDPSRQQVYLVDDLTQDGVPDLFASDDWGNGEVLINGRDGTVVWSTAIGFEAPAVDATVLSADANHDGVPDLIVCEPLAHKNERGRISVRDGASGQQLWHRKGNRRSDRFGDQVWLEDVDQDGIDELISWGQDQYAQFPSTLQCFEFANGATRWRHEFGGAGVNGYVVHRTDLNLDGTLDFVLADYDEDLDQSTLRAVDGNTGIELWGQQLRLESLAIHRIRELRINSDGVPDLVLTAVSARYGPGGWVISVDGASGTQVWRHEFDPGTTRGGALATHLDALGNWHVFYSQAAIYRADSSLVALAGSTGRELWRDLLDLESGQSEELEIVDWNGDGNVELLHRPRNGEWYNQVEFSLFDPLVEPGRLWSTSDLQLSGRRGLNGWFGASLDRDGDGWLDPLMLGAAGSGNDRAIAVSGKDGTRIAGIDLDQSTVSASLGGNFELAIDAGTDRSDEHYQLLFSDRGAGSTQMQSLAVPLASSLWLTRSSIGIYPPRVFSDPIGTLDQDGKTKITIDIPAGALVQWTGRKLAFCVITHRLLSGPPEWSTGAACLEVKP